MTSTSATPHSAQRHALIDQLWVYPIKSCAGISVQHATLTDTGLDLDRAWMVVDAQGQMLTQRAVPRMALIQPELRHAELVLRAPGMLALHLSMERAEAPTQVQVWQDTVPAFEMGSLAAQWFTDFLGQGPLRLVRFDPDHFRLASREWTKDVDAFNQFSDGFPVLVTSTASLDELNTRLVQQGLAPVDMRRFRANLVLRGETPDAWQAHDEDRVGVMTVATDGGAVQLQPVKPCPRCPMPNVNPDTAEVHPGVGDTLQTYRQDPRVNGAVTFGMNAIPLSGMGKVLRVGQRVSADWAF
jgi:uncharacterized protein YcbX